MVALAADWLAGRRFPVGMGGVGVVAGDPANDGTTGDAVLASLLRVLASGADGSRGREHWDSLMYVVNGQGSSAAGSEVVGVAELAALRQQPDDTASAETLARVLLARSRDDESFRSDFSAWRGQRAIQAAEQSLRDGAINGVGSSPAQKTSPRKNKPQKKSWQERLSGPWPVTIGGGLVVVVGGIFITSLLTGANPPSASSAPASPASSPTAGPPVQINSVQVVQSVRSPGLALPAVVRLSQAQLAQLNFDTYNQVLSSEGGIRVGTSQVDVAVTGNAATPARITGINVIDRSCRPPLTGTLFETGGGQGEGPTIAVSFDLDAPDPVPLTTSGQEFFIVHTISLQLGEQQTLVIESATERHFCQYELQLVVLVGSHTTTETITDHGKPFQALATAPFSNYGAIYVGGFLNTDSLHGAFVPVNPATYKGGLIGRYAS